MFWQKTYLLPSKHISYHGFVVPMITTIIVTSCEKAMMIHNMPTSRAYPCCLNLIKPDGGHQQHDDGTADSNEELLTSLHSFSRMGRGDEKCMKRKEGSRSN